MFSKSKKNKLPFFYELFVSLNEPHRITIRSFELSFDFDKEFSKTGLKVSRSVFRLKFDLKVERLH